MTITAITCSMLESPPTSDYDKINTGAPKSIHFETIIKHLTKETRLGQRSARNLERRGHNIRVKIFTMENFTLK